MISNRSWHYYLILSIKTNRLLIIFYPIVYSFSYPIIQSLNSSLKYIKIIPHPSSNHLINSNIIKNIIILILYSSLNLYTPIINLNYLILNSHSLLYNISSSINLSIYINQIFLILVINHNYLYKYPTYI